MKGKTHVAIAEATIIGVTLVSPVAHIYGMTVYPGIAIVTAGLAAVVADCDLSTSKYGRKFPLMGKIFTHRGFTHTSIVGIGLSLLFLAMKDAQAGYRSSLAQSLMFGFALAYITHLVADTFNFKGTPVFFPIVRNKIHIMRITTGGASEPIFLVCYIVLVFLHLIAKI